MMCIEINIVSVSCSLLVFTTNFLHWETDGSLSVSCRSPVGNLSSQLPGNRREISINAVMFITISKALRLRILSCSGAYRKCKRPCGCNCAYSFVYVTSLNQPVAFTLASLFLLRLSVFPILLN